MKTINSISDSNEGCITSDMLLKYIKGELSGLEKNRVERHVASCEMCRDELEGLLQLQNPDEIINFEDKLSSRIDEVLSKEKKVIPLNFYVKIAASVIILFGISTLIYLVGFRNQSTNLVSSNAEREELNTSFAKDSGKTFELKEAEGIKKMKSQAFALSEASKDIRKPAPQSRKVVETAVNYVAPVVVDSVSEIVADEAVVEEVKMDIVDSVSPVVSEMVEVNQVAAAYAPAKTEEVDKEALMSKKSKMDTGRAITIRGVSSMSTFAPNKELAIKLYIVGDYQNALYLFKKLNKKYPESDTIQYYTSMCYYKLNQYDSSLKSFKVLTNNTNSSFYNESMWYYSLSLIKVDKKEKAIEVLKKIISGSSLYKDEAKSKLDSLVSGK